MALCRALHDPFIPSRQAALTALHATMDAIPPQEIAKMVLPALCPHLIDAESAAIREQALKAVTSGLRRVEEYVAGLPSDEERARIASKNERFASVAAAGAASIPTSPAINKGWSLGGLTEKVPQRAF